MNTQPQPKTIEKIVEDEILKILEIYYPYKNRVENSSHKNRALMMASEVRGFVESLYKKEIQAHEKQVLEEMGENIWKKGLRLYDEEYNHGEQEDGSTTFITEKQFDNILKALKSLSNK